MPVKINCTVPGHGNEWVEYRDEGWKMSRLLAWERAGGVTAIWAVIRDFVSGWNLTGEDGQPLSQPTWKTLDDDGQPLPQPVATTSVDALGELHPGMQWWLTVSFRTAYYEVAALSRPFSQPSSVP